MYNNMAFSLTQWSWGTHLPRHATPYQVKAEHCYYLIIKRACIASKGHALHQKGMHCIMQPA